MVLFYSLLHYKHYRCWECNPALLPVTTLNKWFTCSDQPGWHFLLFFTDWIIFQPQNVCSHILACKKCPLCQALLLNDPELEWSQALEVWKVQLVLPLSYRVSFWSIAAYRPLLSSWLLPSLHQYKATLLGVTTVAPLTKSTYFRMTFSSTLSSYLRAQMNAFTRICAFPQSTQQSQLLGSCC